MSSITWFLRILLGLVHLFLARQLAPCLINHRTLLWPRLLSYQTELISDMGIVCLKYVSHGSHLLVDLGILFSAVREQKPWGHCELSICSSLLR